MDSGQFFPTLSEENLEPARPLLQRFRDLAGRMDQAYRETSSNFHFICKGCADNCCHTWFFHHTLSEGLFLAKACAKLSRDTLTRAEKRAKDIMELSLTHDPEQGQFRAGCPLCASGQCLVYENRPMICRLHGVPYRLFRPNGGYTLGPGCAAFDAAAEKAGSQADILDRTPLYAAMAGLETEIRRTLGFFSGKARYTVAGLLCQTAAWANAVSFFRGKTQNVDQDQS